MYEHQADASRLGLTLQQAQTQGKEPESEQTTPTSTDIAEASGTHLSLVMDGETVEIKEQIQASLPSLVRR